MIRRLSFVLVAWLACPALVAANTYYVATTGSDSNSCTTAQSSTAINAKLTVRAAIGCATAQHGDAVRIHAGTYTSSDDWIDTQTYTIPSGTSFANALTISGVTGESQPTIRGGFPVRLNGGVTYLIIQNIIFDGDHTASETIYTFNAPFVLFDGVTVINAHDFGVHMVSDNTTLQNSSIHDNGTNGLGSTNGHGIYNSASSTTIQNNDIYANYGYGIHNYDASGPLHTNNIIRANKVHGNGLNGGTTYGITVTWGSGTLVYNNLIYDQTFSGAGGILIYSNSTGVKATSNTLWNITAGCIDMQFYGSAPTVQDDIMGSCGSNITDYGGTGTPVISNNVTSAASSNFTNVTTHDFTLTAGSTALNAGITQAAYAVDYINTSRPQGSAWDIGAYERIASPVVAPRWSAPPTTALPSSCNTGEQVNLTTGSTPGAYVCDTPNVWRRL